MRRRGMGLAGGVLALVLGTATPASSQTVPSGSPTSPVSGLTVKIGLEPQLVVSLGYLRGIGGGGDRRAAGVGAGVRVSPYLLREGSARVEVTAAGRWFPASRWGMTGATHLYLARSRNRAATAHGIGLEARAAPGYRGERWGLAGDVGWQGTLLTHIRFGEAARSAFQERYPQGTSPEGRRGDPPGEGPVNGWYGATAHRFRVGILATRSLGAGYEVQTGTGGLFSPQRQGIRLGFAHGQVPFYLEASVRRSDR